MSIKITIKDFENLIKIYEQDSIDFSHDIAKYSKHLKNKASNEKHDTAVMFLAIVKKDRVTAIEGKQQWEAKLKNVLP